MQIPPCSLLATIVKHYLIIEQEQHVPVNYRFFSDGNPGLVFHFKDPLLQFKTDNNELQQQAQCFAYGQITHYNSLVSNGKLAMLVVVLQPYALFTLFKIAAHELTNATISLTDLLGSNAVYLQEQVMSTSNSVDAIAVIERFLIKHLVKPGNPDAIVHMALNKIYLLKGVINIESLLKTFPATERQLERKFKEHIGVSPKKMADIVKLQHFLKGMQMYAGQDNITTLSYRYGYYDQAHLNNYFKKHTGITPLQYKTNNNPLALNLIAVG